MTDEMRNHDDERLKKLIGSTYQQPKPTAEFREKLRGEMMEKMKRQPARLFGIRRDIILNAAAAAAVVLIAVVFIFGKRTPRPDFVTEMTGDASTSYRNNRFVVETGSGKTSKLTLDRGIGIRLAQKSEISLAKAAIANQLKGDVELMRGSADFSVDEGVNKNLKLRVKTIHNTTITTRSADFTVTIVHKGKKVSYRGERKMRGKTVLLCAFVAMLPMLAAANDAGLEVEIFVKKGRVEVRNDNLWQFLDAGGKLVVQGGGGKNAQNPKDKQFKLSDLIKCKISMSKTRFKPGEEMNLFVELQNVSKSNVTIIQYKPATGRPFKIKGVDESGGTVTWRSTMSVRKSQKKYVILKPGQTFPYGTIRLHMGEFSGKFKTLKLTCTYIIDKKNGKETWKMGAVPGSVTSNTIKITMKQDSDKAEKLSDFIKCTISTDKTVFKPGEEMNLNLEFKNTGKKTAAVILQKPYGTKRFRIYGKNEKGEDITWKDPREVYRSDPNKLSPPRNYHYKLKPGETQKYTLHLHKGKFSGKFKTLKMSCKYTISDKRLLKMGDVYLGSVTSNAIKITMKRNSDKAAKLSDFIKCTIGMNKKEFKTGEEMNLKVEMKNISKKKITVVNWIPYDALCFEINGINEKGVDITWKDRERSYDRHFLKRYKLKPGETHKFTIRLHEGKFSGRFKTLKLSCKYTVEEGIADPGDKNLFSGSVQSNTIEISMKDNAGESKKLSDFIKCTISTDKTDFKPGEKMNLNVEFKNTGKKTAVVILQKPYGTKRFTLSGLNEKGDKITWKDPREVYRSNPNRRSQPRNYHYKLKPGGTQKYTLRLHEGEFSGKFKILKLSCKYTISDKRLLKMDNVYLGSVTSNTIDISIKPDAKTGLGYEQSSNGLKKQIYDTINAIKSKNDDKIRNHFDMLRIPEPKVFFKKHFGDKWGKVLADIYMKNSATTIKKCENMIRFLAENKSNVISVFKKKKKKIGAQLRGFDLLKQGTDIYIVELKDKSKKQIGMVSYFIYSQSAFRSIDKMGDDIGTPR